MYGDTVLSMQLWDDVEESAVAFPRTLNATWISNQFRARKIELYMQAHLVPRAADDPEYKARWVLFWRFLAFGDKRARTVVKLLHEWQEAAATKLKSMDPEDPDWRRVRNFHRHAGETIDRVKRERGGPLGWSEPEFAGFDVEARIVIENLAVAINEHAAGRITDAELHALLVSQHLDKDPRGIPRETQEAVRQTARKALSDRTRPSSR